MPAATIKSWLDGNQLTLDATFLGANEVQAASALQTVGILNSAVLGTQGDVVTQALNGIPFGLPSPEDKVRIQNDLAEALLKVPADMQSDYATLASAVLSKRSLADGKSTKAFELRAQYTNQIIQAGNAIKSKLANQLKTRYEGNKEAQAGIDEFVQTGRIGNATNAASILMSQIATASPTALDAATTGTYFEGALQLIANDVESQMAKFYSAQDDVNAAASDANLSGFDRLQAMIAGKDKMAKRPDTFLLQQAAKRNARPILDAAYVKIRNSAYAGILTTFAKQNEANPELANSLLNMLDGVGSLSTELGAADAKQPANEAILFSLMNWQDKLKAQGKLDQNVDLVSEFAKVARQRTFYESAISSLRPPNEIGASLDSILTGGNMMRIFNGYARSDFSQSTIKKVQTAYETWKAAQQKQNQNGAQ